MKIRDIEVEFDFLDADDVEKFEREAKKVQEICKEKQKIEMPTSQAIREECKVINDFFDNVFGEGVSVKIFNEKNNLMDHVKAFEDIVQEKIKNEKDLSELYGRYQPNREQRRYNQKYEKRNR